MTLPGTDLSMLQTLHNANLTIPHVPIDPRFSIRASKRPLGLPLDSRPLLMVAVREMSMLAWSNWESQIISFQSAPSLLPGPSDVKMIMRVADSVRSMDVRIAVWGFYAALNSMALKNEYLANDYDFLWDRIPVARLSIRSTPSVRDQHNETGGADQAIPFLLDPDNKLINAAIGNSRKSGNLTAPFSSETFHGDCWYRVEGKPLSFSEVLVSLTSALKTVAAVPIDSMMDENFAVGTASFDARIIFAGPEGRRISIGRNSYQYKWVIRAIYAITMFLLRGGRPLAEADVKMIVEGQYIGLGELRNGRITPSSYFSSGEQ